MAVSVSVPTAKIIDKGTGLMDHDGGQLPRTGTPSGSPVYHVWSASNAARIDWVSDPMEARLEQFQFPRHEEEPTAFRGVLRYAQIEFMAPSAFPQFRGETECWKYNLRHD